MTWRRTTNQFGKLVYVSEDGRAEILRYEAVPPARRVRYMQRIGNQHERAYERGDDMGQVVTRLVRYRKKQTCYAVRVDGRRVRGADRVWYLDAAKSIAEDHIRRHHD